MTAFGVTYGESQAMIKGKGSVGQPFHSSHLGVAVHSSYGHGGCATPHHEKAGWVSRSIGIERQVVSIFKDLCFVLSIYLFLILV